MIEILGVAIAHETIIAVATALIVDEILPFLPTRANGILHAIVLGLKRSRLGNRSNQSETSKIDEVLSILKKWDKEVRND